MGGGVKSRRCLDSNMDLKVMGIDYGVAFTDNNMNFKDFICCSNMIIIEDLFINCIVYTVINFC